MPGRPIPAESAFANTGLGNPQIARRREILKETVAKFQNADPPDRYHKLAAANLRRWQERAKRHEEDLKVGVAAGDWGDVTLSLTKEYGECFAVLNMANAHVPGGAYVEGAAAQEENMFRRTDCHFSIGENEYDRERDRYLPAMTALLEARNGKVYLDIERPRVCIRGPEDRSRDDLGYLWLAPDQIFPFYELRAAAQDVGGGAYFDDQEARRRIAAQLDTLRDNGVHHAVLGAFGCGAFQNPAHRVAQIYKEEIANRRGAFSIIAFAILSAGYGPDNYTPFYEVFSKPT